MNFDVLKNDFNRDLGALLEAIGREARPAAADDFQIDGARQIHEHDTRIFFFDRFISMLGWQLGLGGDVDEEVRIKDGTTRFIDYVGVNDETEAPVLLLEAKAWDKPMVRPRIPAPSAEYLQLIVAAIRHIHDGGEAAQSPVSGDWHDYLVQVGRYVRRYRDNYDHDLPCAVLASGKWIIVFTSPVDAFARGQVSPAEVRIFVEEQYLERSDEIFDLLAKAKLAAVTPLRVRPAQLGHHFNAANYQSSFHAMLVKYESSGSKLIGLAPRVLVYPALLFMRSDGALFTVIGDEPPCQMIMHKDGPEGSETLDAHLAAVADGAAGLIADCSAELGVDVAPSPLASFPGFSGRNAVEAPGGTSAVRRIAGTADEWIIATGDSSHFILPKPRIVCRFHRWSACREVGAQVGQGAVGTPVVGTPRAFFTDGNANHCAHATIIDRREPLCQIAALDARTCCSACALHQICWSDTDADNLPCGS